MSPFGSTPTPLDRLETALSRMQQKHGFCRLASSSPDFPAGLCALLLTEDPQRNPEVLDACVILPEALKPLGEAIQRLVAGPETAAALQTRYGITRPPAVLFLRDGQYLGALSGIRDWRDYQAEVQRLLAAPVQPRPIPIPVVAAPAAPTGACA